MNCLSVYTIGRGERCVLGRCYLSNNTRVVVTDVASNDVRGIGCIGSEIWTAMERVAASLPGIDKNENIRGVMLGL